MKIITHEISESKRQQAVCKNLKEETDRFYNEMVLPVKTVFEAPAGDKPFVYLVYRLVCQRHYLLHTLMSEHIQCNLFIGPRTFRNIKNDNQRLRKCLFRREMLPRDDMDTRLTLNQLAQNLDSFVRLAMEMSQKLYEYMFNNATYTAGFCDGISFSSFIGQFNPQHPSYACIRFSQKSLFNAPKLFGECKVSLDDAKFYLDVFGAFLFPYLSNQNVPVSVHDTFSGVIGRLYQIVKNADEESLTKYPSHYVTCSVLWVMRVVDMLVTACKWDRDTLLLKSRYPSSQEGVAIAESLCKVSYLFYEIWWYTKYSKVFASADPLDGKTPVSLWPTPTYEGDTWKGDLF